ncbi:MAG TPA: arylsulfatase, partial [Chitinophagaceae bacterium]|nr:arylsulfatase [Chitinophagaceae bacterium]
MKRSFYLVIFSMLYCLTATAQSTKPNIIYILADDLGYGDLSCYNAASKIKTPVIDALASEGMRFTDAHSGSSVCSPTRYGILTGRYAWRTRMQEGVLWSYDDPLIPNNRLTVAGFLKSEGYSTAVVGKWHLGLRFQVAGNRLQERVSADNVDLLAPLQAGPTSIGFDYFYGITSSLDIPPYVWIENDKATATSIDTIEERKLPGFWRRGPVGNDFKHEEVLPKIIDKSTAFIQEQAAAKKPFFLYIPLTAPHTPILPTPEYAGRSGTTEYGDFTIMTDQLVKRVLDAVKIAGIENNTIIILTSDNGCAPYAGIDALAAMGHQVSGPFRGAKADIWEGGHRIPFIAKWPGKIAPGSSSSKTICLTDLFATLADMLGKTLPDSVAEDSYSILPLMLRKDGFARPSTIHHSVFGHFAIRKDNWKLIFAAGSGGWASPNEKKAAELKLPPIQLYDLDTDPGEKINLAFKHSFTVS